MKMKTKPILWLILFSFQVVGNACSEDSSDDDDLFNTGSGGYNGGDTDAAADTDTGIYAGTGGIPYAGTGGTGGMQPVTGGTGGVAAVTGGAGGVVPGTGGAGAGTGGATGAGTGGAAGAGTGGAAGAGTGGVGGAGTGGGGAAGSDCRVWMATNGTDSDTCGSSDNPCATISQAYNVLCPIPENAPAFTECQGPAPRILCIRPGTYQMTERFQLRRTRIGTESNPVIVQGDPSSSEKPHFDFTNADHPSSSGDDVDPGFSINSDWTVLRDVEISNAGDNCVLLQAENILVERVVVHDCYDTGILISTDDKYDTSGTNNTVRNCDSYDNYDVHSNGEDADGFGAKENNNDCGGNVFEGCRAWNNADDGFDLYGWTQSVTIRNSWSLLHRSPGGNSDGNGFKLGSSGLNVSHNISDLISVGNVGDGFTANGNSASQNCSGNCYAWDNGTNFDSDGGSITGVSESRIGSVTGATLRDAPRNADGSLPDPSSL